MDTSSRSDLKDEPDGRTSETPTVAKRGRGKKWLVERRAGPWAAEALKRVKEKPKGIPTEDVM